MNAKSFDRICRPLRVRPGQSLVEFVLVAPLLFLLFFGIVEFARAWNIRHVVTDAAREGARTMVVYPDTSTAAIQIVVENALQAAGLNVANATISLVRCEGPDCGSPDIHVSGMAARAQVTYRYELRMVRVFIGWVMDDPVLDIHTTSVMRNE